MMELITWRGTSYISFDLIVLLGTCMYVSFYDFLFNQLLGNLLLCLGLQGGVVKSWEGVV